MKFKKYKLNESAKEVEESLGGALLTGAAAGGAMALANKAVGGLLGEDGDPDYTDDYYEKGFRWYKIIYNVRDVDDTIRHEDAEMTVLAKDKDGAMDKFTDSTEYLNKHGFYASDIYVKLNEDLASDIRKNNLDYDDEIDALYKKDGDTEIQFQDRETHYHDMKSPSPRTSSHTWGRVWKNGKLDKSFDGSKYEVRQNMAKYLDSKNESFKMQSNIPDLEEVAQQIWEDFQPDKIGEENWIEFDNDDARKMLGTNNETMSFEAIGPNSKVRGAMRTQGNRIHVAIRNGSEGVFDSVDEIEDFIKGSLEGFGKKEESLEEDTEKTSKGKWVNRGDTGETHGEFKTKKEADAQRKAMFARGWKGESLEESTDDLSDKEYNALRRNVKRLFNMSVDEFEKSVMNGDIPVKIVYNASSFYNDDVIEFDSNDMSQGTGNVITHTGLNIKTGKVVEYVDA